MSNKDDQLLDVKANGNNTLAFDHYPSFRNYLVKGKEMYMTVFMFCKVFSLVEFN